VLRSGMAPAYPEHRSAVGQVPKGPILPSRGCERGGGESYEDVLGGLRGAASANGGYDAVRRAGGLEPTERASLEAFCAVMRQVSQGGEAAKLSETAYVRARIESDAEARLPFVSTAGVRRAVRRLDSLYDLSSLDGRTARRCARACYR
jgi:hypothetical protein